MSAADPSMINPNYALAHRVYGMSLTRRRRFQEALREARLARKLDPLSLDVRMLLAYIYLFTGQYRRAIAEARDILAVDPPFPRARMVLGRGLFFQGQRETGIEELRAANPHSVWIAYAYAITGRKQEALQALYPQPRAPAALAFGPGDGAGHAIIAAAIGETRRALDLIEELLAKKDQAAPWLFVYPELADLRAETRFQALRRQVGIGGPCSVLYRLRNPVRFQNWVVDPQSG